MKHYVTCTQSYEIIEKLDVFLHYEMESIMSHSSHNFILCVEALNILQLKHICYLLSLTLTHFHRIGFEVTYTCDILS